MPDLRIKSLLVCEEGWNFNQLFSSSQDPIWCWVILNTGSPLTLQGTLVSPPTGKLQHQPLCEQLHCSSQEPVAICWQSQESKSRIGGFLVSVLVCHAYALLSLCQGWTCCPCLLFIPVVNWLSFLPSPTAITLRCKWEEPIRKLKVAVLPLACKSKRRRDVLQERGKRSVSNNLKKGSSLVWIPMSKAVVLYFGCIL